MSLLSKLFRPRQLVHLRSNTEGAIGRAESLESRCMLAGDVAAITGDSNLDGAFDSSDFVQVFTAGKFETGQPATYAEGDWNGDGVFNSSDLVKAFQDGHYDKRILAADAPDGETPDDADPAFGNEPNNDDLEADEDRNHRNHHNHHNHDRDDTDRHDADRLTPEERIRAAIKSIRDRMGAGLADGLDADAVHAALEAAADALENGELDVAKEALNEIRDQFGRRDDAERPSPEERIQGVIDGIQARIDAGLPDGVDAAAIQAALDAANQALVRGELDVAREALRGLRDEFGNREQGERPSPEERIQTMINRLQTAVNEDSLPEGVDPAAVQAAIDTAIAALERGDVESARDALAALRDRDGGRDQGNDNGGEDNDGEDNDGEDNDGDGNLGARIGEIIQQMIARLQTALNDETLPEGIDPDLVRQAIAEAQAALEQGDFDAAKNAISALRGLHGESGNGGRDGNQGDDGNEDGRNGERGDRPRRGPRG